MRALLDDAKRSLAYITSGRKEAEEDAAVADLQRHGAT
jgi:hypothetical protein